MNQGGLALLNCFGFPFALQKSAMDPPPLDFYVIETIYFSNVSAYRLKEGEDIEKKIPEGLYS